MEKVLVLLSISMYFLVQAVKGDESERSSVTISKDVIVTTKSFLDKIHYFDIELEESAFEYEYLKINVFPETQLEVQTQSSIAMYVSSFSPKPTVIMSEYQSLEPYRAIYLPRKFFLGKKFLYLKVEDTAPLQFTLKIHPIKSIYTLNAPEFFKMEIKGNKLYEFECTNNDPLNEGNLMIALTGTSSNSKWNLDGKITCGKEEIQLQKLFHNGIGATITKDNLKKCSEEKIFFSFTSLEDDKVTIEFRKLIEGKPYYLYPNEINSIVFNQKYSNEILFSFSPKDQETFNESSSESSDESSNEMIILWKSYKENLIPSVVTVNNGMITVRENLKYSEFYFHLYKINDPKKEFFSILLKDNFDIGSVQIQIISKNKWSSSYPVISYLDLGVPVSGTIPGGKGIYYRIKGNYKNSFLDVLFQRFGGPSHLFQVRCSKSLEACYALSHDLSYLAKKGIMKEIKMMNNFAYEEIAMPNNDEETVLIVYCGEVRDEDDDDDDEDYRDTKEDKNATCSFDLSIRKQDSYMYLSRNMRYNSPITMNEKTIYSFRVSDKEVNEIGIILYSYSGDVSMKVGLKKDSFDEDKFPQKNVQNKKYVKILGESLANEYFIMIEGKSTGYYTIYFTTFTKDSERVFQVQSGELTTETVNKKEYSKVFSIFNRNAISNSPFVVTFTTLNCKIKVNFQDEEQVSERSQFIITKENKIYSSGRYPFTVQFLSIDTGSIKEDDDCIFYITGSDNNRYLQLNEGIIHSMKITKENKYVLYGYDLYYYKNEVVTVSLTKLDNTLLVLGYWFGDTNQKVIYVTSSRMLILHSSEILEGCKGKALCRLFMEISPSYETEIQDIGVQFQIGVTSNHLVPTYLKKGDMRLDGVFGKQGGSLFKSVEYIYYYTDLPKDANCEVVVDFKRGSGNAIASLYKKDLPEKPLPKKNFTDLIPFDYYNKKFTLTEKETSECDDGCELIIGVYSDVESNYFSYNEFSIFIRNTFLEPTVISLPVNEYVYGSLSRTEVEEFNYYSTLILKDTDRIILEFNSDLCAGYININTDELPTKENYDYMIQSKDSFIIIKASDSKIKDGTFLDKKINIAIGTKTLDGKYNSFYSYRVITPDKGKKTIISINSSGNVICKLEDGKCYFRMEMYLYHYINEIYLYAFSDKVNEEKIEIYANVFEFKEYKEKEIKDIEALLPSENNYNYTSKNDFESDRLHLPIIKQDKQDIHVYIMIKTTSKDGLIKLLSTFLRTPIKTTLRPNSYQMFSVEKNFYVNFEILGNDIYYVETVRILGDGYLENEGEEIKLNGEYMNLATIIKPSNSKGIKIKAGNQENFIFYVKYIVRTDQGNFDEIPYGRINHIQYLKETFPITYFIPVGNDINTDIVVTIQFHSEEIKEDFETPKDFILTGAITDESYIISRKKAIDDNPVIEAYSSVSFNKDLQLGKYIFKKSDIEESKGGSKYFFVQIKQDINNLAEYKKVTLDILAMPVSLNEINIPINQYFYTKIDNSKETYIKLKKSELQHKIMKIEFALNTTEFEISIFTDKDKNKPPLKENKIFGKTVYEIKELDEKNYVIIKLTPISSKSFSNLMIKYRSSPNHFEEYKVLDNDMEIKVESSNKEFIGKVNSIQSLSNEKSLEAKYMLRLFEFNKYKSESVLDSLGNMDVPFKSFKGVLDKERKEVEFNIKDFPKGEYYINVVAILSEEKEQFLYKTKYIKKGVLIGSTYVNWVIILLVIFVLLICGVIFILYRKISKVKSMQKSNLIEYSALK